MPAAAPPPALRFENVGYRFAGSGRQALSGVTLAVGAGERLALVGGSGAGKTTLGHLLLAFDRPSSGRIWVDGRDLGGLDPESWRRCVSWVGQAPFLFHGTIRENIRLGDPQAPAAAVEEAARAAGVAAFCGALPQGLDTPVGERGVGLSRGQAQQVALARAFLKRAPLLVLDEPTAGLDGETEERVMAAVHEFCRFRTLICMTHRLGRLEAFDRIAVLAAGRVSEQGTFAALARSGGRLSRFLELKGAAGGSPPEGR
jgi:ATP-binding cassette subfamily C protein CydD